MGKYYTIKFGNAAVPRLPLPPPSPSRWCGQRGILYFCGTLALIAAGVTLVHSNANILIDIYASMSRLMREKNKEREREREREREKKKNGKKGRRKEEKHKREI